MQEFHRRITAVRAEPTSEETSTDLLAGATLIPLADSGDFSEWGGHVRILGEVYEYDAMDTGHESGVPSITLTTGLLVDVPAETMVEEWNNTRGEVITDWVATVTDEIDGSSCEALLSHTLISMIATGIPVVGESVVVQVDDEGTWWVTNVIGATPGIQPGFFVSGGIGTDTVVWAGTEDGRRAQLDGIDGALECFDSTNTQTVNLDGDENYVLGTLATGKDDQPRVEVGAGALFLEDVNEVRIYTGDADEVSPALFRGGPSGGEGRLVITPPTWAGHTGVTSTATFASGSASLPSAASLQADNVSLGGDSIILDAPAVEVVTGTLDATMGNGSVGTGTFRDSVDARVTAVGGAAYQPLDSDLTAIAALSTTAYGRALLALADQAALTASVANASTTAAGIVELATQAEVNAGVDDTRAFTPAKLQIRLAGYAQPLDTDLTAIAALTSAADKMPYATGAGTWALTDITSVGRSILDDTTTAAVRTTIAARDRYPSSVNVTTTPYTLVLSDDDKIIQMNSASAQTLNIPTNASVAFPNGTEIRVWQLGAGAVTIDGSAVTLNGKGYAGSITTCTVSARYGECRLRKRATDSWVITGDFV